MTNKFEITGKVIADIERIAIAIKEDREQEEKESIINKAIASFEVIINSYKYTLWLVNGAINSGISFTKDIVGMPIIVQNKTTTLKRSGKNRTFSKNSKIAGQLILAQDSLFSFSVGKYHNEVLVLSQADYNPFGKGSDATNITIRFKKDKEYYSYISLNDILKKIEEKKKEFNELEQLKNYYIDNEDELQKCIQNQRKVEDEINTLYSKKQEFIIEHAKLRYKAILDPIQENVKRGNFFNDSLLLIDGGPGTGKTTTLIQRIKFLIDPIVIEENSSFFTNEEKNILLSENNPTWIFFSPNELLYLYLIESMSREGLRATSETGKIWNQYRTTLVWMYSLSSKNTKKPFILARSKSNEALFESISEALSLIKYEFEKTLVKEIILKLNKLLDSVSSNSKETSSEIKRYIYREPIKDLNNIILICFGIRNNFDAHIKNYNIEYTYLIDKLATILKNNILRDSSILEFVQEKFSLLNSTQSDINTNFLEDVDKKFESNRFDNWLFQYCKNVIIKAAILLNDNVEDYWKFLTENKVEKIFKQVLKIETIQEFAKTKKEWNILSEFEDCISSLILNRITSAYIEFRNSESGLSSLKYVNKKVLGDLTINENNRLHPNEQSFLIGYINELLKRIYKKGKDDYQKVNHKFKQAYEENSKMVIAVDEVSDFHIFDLYGIFSLGDKNKNSITISGDLMQRVEDVGIYDWDDLKILCTSLKKYQLKTSYRQSPTLLNLASTIYEKSVKEKFNVSPYLVKHQDEPMPISKISEDEKIKIRWIANKILEIYDNYGGEMPSVAIFLPTEDKIDTFVRQLSEIDDLADVGIVIKACKNGEVLGTGSMVRVFSLKYIKGLEFEAVIFHNLDDLLLSNLGYQDSILRKVYVGLSRATFYLAVTLSKNWSDDLNFLSECFSKEQSWQIKRNYYV